MKPSLAFITLFTLSAVAVQPTFAQGQSPSVTFKAKGFDLNSFQSQIQAQVSGKKTVGYAFAIAKDGKIVRKKAGGKRLKKGEGNKKMTPGTRLNVMSVSKTITAVAVLQLLEKRNLSINAPIAPWLPKNWKRGYGFKKKNSLTFKHLLTHTSGLRQRFDELKKKNKHGPWGNAWDGLKFIVKKGVRKKHVGKQGNFYKNANYALFRVLVPALLFGGPKTVTKQAHVGQYMLYVGSKVTAPSGIKTLACVKANGYKHARAYDVSGKVKGGSLPLTSMTGCGGHAGFQLSAVELAMFMKALRCRGKKSKLLSKKNCKRMNQHRLGWNRASNGTGNRKGKYWHGGAWFGGKNKPRREMLSCVMQFPMGVEAALVVNSGIKSGKSPCTILLNAFEGAKS